MALNSHTVVAGVDRTKIDGGVRKTIDIDAVSVVTVGWRANVDRPSSEAIAALDVKVWINGLCQGNVENDEVGDVAGLDQARCAAQKVTAAINRPGSHQESIGAIDLEEVGILVVLVAVKSDTGVNYQASARN